LHNEFAPRGSEYNRGTGCGKTARPGLCGGRWVTGVPTERALYEHKGKLMKNDKKNVVVKTYLNETEAQLAQFNLESVGIETHIHKDDCGGAYPQLQVAEGVQLIVDINDVERAEAILNEIIAEEVQDKERTGKTKKSPMWRVFFVGVLTGVFLSTITFMILNKDGLIENSKLEFDINEDGSPDEFHYYEKGMLVKIEEDRNYDGKPDLWSYYESDRVMRSDSDDNFDGKVDGWATYKDRNNFQIKYDNDFDGISDATYYYANGIKQRVDWHPGDSSIIIRRVIFKDSIKSKEYIDYNNDGNFDIKLSFDAFEKEVSRSSYTE
jgi:antitoxin component YwqK of YwqJK toxin-antitoxin module